MQQRNRQVTTINLIAVLRGRYMGALRNIKSDVERLLWGVTAGRCEFQGCNKILYRHEVTGASDNYAEKAHIYAVNPGGARFNPESEEFRNNFNNLILVCPQCHVTIDRNEELYTAERLFEMKLKHEKRIFALTNIGADLHSHMVYYTANIASTHLSVNDGDARCALAAFGKYPSEDSPIDLSQRGSYVEDNESSFYENNARNLERAVKSRILDVVERGSSISLFALAPQPLLMYLGRLLNDKYNVAVFQCHRRELDKWRWQNEYKNVDFIISHPTELYESAKVALVFSLSATIAPERIKSVIGENATIYTVTIESPNRQFVTHFSIMDSFISSSRGVMEEIKQKHGKNIEIHVFPAMPESLAIRFGMDYMPKTDSRLIIYDEQPEQGFVPALKIGGSNDN